MKQNKKSRKKIIIGFGETSARDQRLWRQLMTDKAENTINMSDLIKGLLAAYYDHRELTGSIALPSYRELVREPSDSLPHSGAVEKPIDLNDLEALGFAAAIEID